MDPLTHVLLGASLGHVAFHRRLGRSAAVAGGLAAFAPDADIFIRSAADPLLAIEHHRGFTHALAFAPVGAAIVAALWLIRPSWRASLSSAVRSARLPPDTERPVHRPPWRALWACALVAYLSHALLDAATSYGTRLLWPFSDARFGWDIVSVIDPLVTLPLLAGLIGALRAQRVRLALAGLGVAGVYLACGALQHTRAVAAQRAIAAARGHTIERFEVMPTLANNLVWRALYEHRGKIYSDRVRVGWFSAPTVREGWRLPQIDEHGLTADERARNARRSFERFAWFSEGWVARSPGDPRVLGDMRYSLSAEAFDPIWGIRFLPPGAPTEVEWVNRARDRKIDPRELWREISGGDERFATLARAE